MSEKKVVKPVALAVGAALASSFALAGTTSADGVDSPFSMSTLNVGYMLGEGEGACGEGSCGEGDKDKDGEGACGEGSCGAKDKDKDKKGEGSCGEGSCGEGSCGEGEKEGEGACGEGSCGGSV